MNDNCAGCGEKLTAAPLGGRLRCCDDRYWSAARPLMEDERVARTIGYRPMQTCLRVSDGERMKLYRRAL